MLAHRSGVGRLLVALCIGATALGPVGIEAQSADLRLHGLVTAPSDEPVSDAVVRLYLAQNPQSGPASVHTDESGQWVILLQDPGRWEIEISADGFLTSVGWVQVLQGRPTPRLDVELRRLDEGTPAFLEGDRGTVQRWLERANDLLAQGETARARAEYEKALRAVPIAEHPDILQAVARTYFLENNYEAAVSTLEDGLRISPGDAVLRRLYALLLEELGRGEEIDRRLEDLAATPPAEIDPAAARPSRVPNIERPPVEDTPVAGRVGHYRTRFAERSPLSRMEIYLERFDYTREEIESHDSAAGRYDLGDESFDIYVPESDGEKPLGLFVFVSPTPFGGFTKQEIADVLADRRLIWVGPDNIGNRRSSWYRIHLALDAVHNLSKLYDIDPDRIYIAGYSGGGRIASSMSLLYREVFSGGFFLYGTDWFEPHRVIYQPGAVWPARFAAPGKSDLAQARRESRLVFLTGSRDFNRAQTKSVYRNALEIGFEHATYLEIPDADHYFGISGEWLERGIAALDAPLASHR